MTKLTQNERIEKVEKLFDEIKKLLPESSISMSIHDIDVIKLPRKWKVERDVVKDTGHIFFSARRENYDTFDITLFD